jgi:RimJ/RimL family protein N-acetyltransferase
MSDHLQAWRRAFIQRFQQLFWVYVTVHFHVKRLEDFRQFESSYRVRRITEENSHRAVEFREQSLVSEYLGKLNHGELGFFAEVDGKILGSLWATLNGSAKPKVVRSYMKLEPGEALIHDIVTGEESRGRGIAPFLLSRALTLILHEFSPKKIIIDVNSRNQSSLRVMDKLGLKAQKKVLCVSALGEPRYEKTLSEYHGKIEAPGNTKVVQEKRLNA